MSGEAEGVVYIEPRDAWQEESSSPRVSDF
jgi:hypothetical protein